MNVPIDPAELTATKSFYDRISRAYDLLAHASEHDAREKGLELLDARAGERVLEIGFGTGHVLVSLARAVGQSGAVCGVDISNGMRDVARRRLGHAGLTDRVELRVAAVPPLPFGDACFDAVFMSFTLELFPPDIIPLLLAEVRRVLSENGRLAVVAMAAHTDGQPDNLVERAYKWMHRHFPHIVDCRPIDVGTLLGAAGFRITEQADLEIWSLSVKAALATVSSRD